MLLDLGSSFAARQIKNPLLSIFFFMKQSNTQYLFIDTFAMETVYDELRVKSFPEDGLIAGLACVCQDIKVIGSINMITYLTVTCVYMERVIEINDWT